MKSIRPQSLYFSPNPLRALKEEAPAKSSDQSPYLKAILTEKRVPGTDQSLPVVSSSMAAALRYIANSK